MLQLIGNTKNRNVQKVERYLKERRISYQYIDITKKELSEKEWRSIFNSVSDPMEIMDTEGTYYKKNGYAWKDFNPTEEIIMHPELLKLPVLRNGQKCVFTLDEAFIKEASL